MTDVPLLYRWRDAFVSSDLPALTKLVLFVIAHHMRPDGTGSWPSQRLIANEASMSVQSANKFIRLAEGRGYLERSDGRVRGQSWRHHSYFPAIPNHGKVFNEVEHVDQHSETEGVQPDGTPQAFNLVEGVQPHSEGVQQGGTKVFNYVELNSSSSPKNKSLGGVAVASPRSQRNGGKAPNRKNTGTRISDDWKLNDELRQAAVAIGIPTSNLENVAAKFRDHWLAKSGSNANKVDWVATWRNWCRSERDYRPNSNSSQPTRLRNTPVDYPDL